MTILFFCNAKLFSQSPDSWQQRASFPGTPRQEAACFAVGGKGYIITGSDSAGNLLNDGWSYDPVADAWTVLAPFPGGSRRGAVGFSVKDTGYVATGFDGSNELKDIWRYDAGNDTWTRLQDLGSYLAGNFPGRTSATAITTDTIAYLVGGYDGSPGYVKQVLRFNPSNDTTWSLARNFANVSDLSLSGRRWGSGFAIGNAVYCGTGFTNSQDIKQDVWRYDPTINSWAQVADFGGGFRSNAFAFSLWGKGYIGGGDNGAYSNDVWCYLPTLNRWTSVAPFRGGTRINAYAFVIGNRAYVGAGKDYNGILHNDCWEYTPDSTTEISTISPTELNIAFNNGHLQVNLSNVPDNMKYQSRIRLISMNGIVCLEQELNPAITSIDWSSLSAGVYIYSLLQRGELLVTGKLVKSY